MRSFFSLVAVCAGLWLPASALAQAEYQGDEHQGDEYPPDEYPPVEEAPPPPPSVVVVEHEYEREPERAERPQFVVELQPYAWLPLRMSGETAVVGQSAPVGVRVDGLFDDQFSMAGGLRLEAWANRLGLIADGSFLQLERDGGTTEPDFRSRQFLGDFLAGFRVIQAGPLAGGPSVGFAITGGVRLIYDRERLVSVGNTVERGDWIAKASLGADIPIRFTDAFGLRARGSVRYPDFDWSVLGLVEFDGLPAGVDVGYRYDNLVYEEGGLDLDVDIHSVYLGLGFKVLGPRN